jgi:hypothetical protein
MLGCGGAEGAEEVEATEPVEPDGRESSVNTSVKDRLG